MIGSDGAQLGIKPTGEARALAESQGLDLVEISPTANPPVCKIMDYGKYKYDQEKRAKDARRHQAANRLKEVKFHVNVEAHDYQTKLRHIREFVEEGHRVKVSLYFRGRENAHPELGHEVLKRVLGDCEEFASPESMPNRMGRVLVMMIGPRKRGKPVPAPAGRSPASAG